MRRLCTGVVLAASALAVLPAAAMACADENARPGDVSAKRHAAAIRCLINAERTKRGLRALKVDARLERAAQGHASAMNLRNFFEHESPGGSTLRSRLEAVGYRHRTAGENLAWGAGRRGSPRGIVNGWLRSAFHRRNMLSSRFRELGVGVSRGAPVRRVRNAVTVDLTLAQPRGRAAG